MKHIIYILLLVGFALNTAAQTDNGEEPLAVRVLAIDTSVTIARRFSEKMGELVPEYKLAFIDNETRHMVRYVFKNEKNETLRIDYGFDTETFTEGEKQIKRTVVDYQRISGELKAITIIYNFLFAATLTPERVMSTSTQGSPITFMGKTYQYSFLPDDYEPGYWVLSFLR
ncbi:MAG: hypothetical protein JNK00_03080 [Flavipsychrobacter sp.]|nr:hypothetical protein [Flavipsychrobacter sp.]